MKRQFIVIRGTPYRLATWRRRAIGRIIDVIVEIAPLFILPSEWASLGAFWLIPYLAVGDGLLKGRTIGKRLLGMAVLDVKHGTGCTVLQDFFRHLPVYKFGILALGDRLRGIEPAPPETAVVEVTFVDPEELKIPPEKPAKLDLKGMRISIKEQRENLRRD